MDILSWHSTNNAINEKWTPPFQVEITIKTPKLPLPISPLTDFQKQLKKIGYQMAFILTSLS